MLKRSVILLLVTILVMDSIILQAAQYPSDGIYFNFLSFRKGNPDLLLSQLVKDDKAKQPVSNFRQWFNSERRFFTNDSVGISDFGETPVWGYVENGTVYLLLNGKFHKLLLFGQISYFLESYPIVRDQLSPVVTDARTVSSYRLLDMNTGRIGTYEIGRLETLMKEDEELLAEFRSISSVKTKEKKMYSFIERFNQRHPLIPAE